MYNEGLFSNNLLNGSPWVTKIEDPETKVVV